ncbi:DUF7288 family protein [Halomicrobium katesii]|uniref:DUF7288 family protein n=1 Tax=Halomicrobium katesii TaxID=437163 RepID=UPI0003664631|nr:hypothetical protein [Halomicrobium katesii]
MERGQAYTLEGTIGAIIVVIAVLIGLQAVDTGQLNSQQDQVSEQLSTQSEDVLTVGAETGALSEVVRCWGADKSVVDGTVESDRNARFEKMLNHTFDRQNRNYNLYLSYWNDSVDDRTEQVISTSENQALASPGRTTAVGTQRITLYDDQTIQFGNGCGTAGYEISEGAFKIPDVDEDSPLYNIVEVRLVVW